MARSLLFSTPANNYLNHLFLHYIIVCMVNVFQMTTFLRLTCHYKHQMAAKFGAESMVIQYIARISNLTGSVIAAYVRKSDDCLSYYVMCQVFPGQDHLRSFVLRRHCCYFC